MPLIKKHYAYVLVHITIVNSYTEAGYPSLAVDSGRLVLFNKMGWIIL